MEHSGTLAGAAVGSFCTGAIGGVGVGGESWEGGLFWPLRARGLRVRVRGAEVWMDAWRPPFFAA